MIRGGGASAGGGEGEGCEGVRRFRLGIIPEEF